MNFINDFKNGLLSWFKAVGFIFKHRLHWFFVIPLLLASLLFGAFYILLEQFRSPFKSLLSSWINLPFINSFSNAIFTIFEIVLLIFSSLLIGHLLNIFLSPVYAWLSEKTASLITGKEFKFSFFQLIKDIFRGFLISLRNAVLSFFWSIILGLLGLIFPPIAPFFVIGVNAFFFGFTFIDYNCERHKMGYKDSINFIRSHRWGAIAIGLFMAFITPIPYLGVFMAAFMGIINTVAATIFFYTIHTTPDICT
ncbi:MAG: EI24 domain-containing protein [Chitinophagales bacterium]|nr:EI24 domain-containing protein [Chitinophagales bacterium]